MERGRFERVGYHYRGRIGTVQLHPLSNPKMADYDAKFVSDYKAHSSAPAFLLRRVVQEVVSAIQMPIDEHDRGPELNILAQYYRNALDFASEDMCFDYQKTAEVLNVAKSVISYEAFKPAEMQQHTEAAGESIDTMKKAFGVLREKLTSFSGVFTAEEIRAIAEYFLRSYLGNLRLWLHALSGKHQSETKVVTLFIDTPLPSLPLTKAVERIKLPQEEIASERNSPYKTSRKSTMARGQIVTKQDENRPDGTVAPEVESIDQQIARTTTRIEEEAGKRDISLERALEEARKKK